MTFRADLRRAAVLLFGALACRSGGNHPVPLDPPAGYPYAYAAASCAPWDGYAVSLVLRGDSLPVTDSMIERGDQPQIRIGLYPRTPGIAPSGLLAMTFQWPQSPEVAGGAYCAGGRCESAAKGRVTIGEVMPDGRFSGDLEVTLSNGENPRGIFRAQWRRRTMLCL